MANTQPDTTNVAGTTPSINPGQVRGSGRGRGGGRGGQNAGTTVANNMGIPSDRGEPRANFGADRGQERGRSRGRGRGRGGGRGGRGDYDTRNSHGNQLPPPNLLDSATEKPPPQPGGAVSLDRPTEDAANVTSGELARVTSAGEDADACIVCSNPIEHSSLTPCNHRYCTICSLRLRALYKTKACAYCRTEAPIVIFTDQTEKKYEEFLQDTFYRKADNMGIAYETQPIFEDTVLLLRYNCPDAGCDVACMGWPDLHRHVRSVHHKQMCDLCTRNKKVFTHEHDLFTKEELRKHEKYGDDNPGAIDQSGFKGHPECGFCRKRFYGEDELYVHCRDSHERCHLCDRRTGGQNPQYYLDYNALEQHFGKDHFPCLDPECLEKKFVVFDSEMDLKAHQLESHPNGFSKDARRDARRVDLSSFDYRPQYQEVRRGGRRGGRGRDPNVDPLPAAVTPAHMSRAELAHQREREIQSAQSTTSRTFGGQLTQAEPQAQTVHRPAHAQSPRLNNARPASPALHDRTLTNPPSSPRPAEALTAQEKARQLRHNAVTERAANLLGNDQAKLAEFRERISAYRTGTVTASDLIDAFFSLFDTTSAELGKLIKELADIFELPDKREALIKAWADWKAINEDYPSLPGPSGATSATGVLGSGMSGSRVLRLKSSTAPSAKSKMGQQKSWGAAAASPSNPFPALPPTKGSAPPAPTPAWLTLRPSTAAAAATSGSTSSSAKASPLPSRNQSSSNLKMGESFPALPAAAKPTTTLFSPGYTGSAVLRPTAGTGANAWSSAGASSGQATPSAALGAEEGETGRGKQRKGKNVVFKWG